jgi:hypothetical protein
LAVLVNKKGIFSLDNNCSNFPVLFLVLVNLFNGRSFFELLSLKCLWGKSWSEINVCYRQKHPILMLIDAFKKEAY